MKSTLLSLTLSFCCCGALRASADTIANWQFDDGVPTNSAGTGTLATETNAPALNATAGRYSSGAQYPSFDNDRPGARIWASFTGPLLNSTNAASLRFINADLPSNKDTQNGSLATVPDNPLLRATNLTVEAFLKVDRRMNWPLVVGKVRGGGNTSWNLDFDNSGKPRVRIDSGVAFTNGTPGFNESVTAAVSVEDGKWHHVAFTYTHTNKTVLLYVDYVQSASRTTYSNLVYDSGELRIASGAGARGFDGWIDEIRLTDRVLTPEQFMTVIEPSSTRGYWAFDDGPSVATSGTLTNTFYAPMMHGTSVAMGGAKPTFSSERPPASTTRISSGKNGPAVNLNNDTSLLFVNAGLPANTNSPSGGQVTVTGSGLPAQMTNFTAEAFVRVNRHVNYPQIIGKTRTLTGGYSWSLGINVSGNLRSRFDTQIPTNTVGFNQCLESSGYMEDGKWHHVALTYDYPSQTMKLYKDYVKIHEGVTPNPMASDSGDIKIGNGDMGFDGWIDEVRVTDRVLTPAEFLYTVPIKGAILLLY